jgi:hypothetical protein
MVHPGSLAEKRRPSHHAKKNPLLGTPEINQNINPKGLTLIKNPLLGTPEINQNINPKGLTPNKQNRSVK